MAISNRLKCLILTTLFLSGLSVLPAQTAGYYLDPDSEEPRFIQRLTWSGGMYSLHCEVIIQKEEGGEYVNHLSKSTTGNYLDLSLSPGNYRFRVIPYDILGRPSTGTQWAMFTVFNAVRPELYQPEEKTDYINDKRGFVFVFNGKNLEPDAQIYFVSPKGEQIIPAEIIRSDDGSSVSLVFDKNQLIDGEYEVFVINPGGLETNIGGINFESPKEKARQFLYIVCVSWVPIYPAYGDGFGGGWSLFNMSARLSMNSCMFLNDYIGLEFSFSKFKNDITYVLNGLSGGFNLLYIKWLPGQKAAYNFRIGIGFTVQSTNYCYSTVGVSFLYRIIQNFNIEAGIDYVKPFNGSFGGGILPWIGISLIF